MQEMTPLVTLDRGPSVERISHKGSTHGSEMGPHLVTLCTPRSHLDQQALPTGAHIQHLGDMIAGGKRGVRHHPGTPRS